MTKSTRENTNVDHSTKSIKSHTTSPKQSRNSKQSPTLSTSTITVFTEHGHVQKRDTNMFSMKLSGELASKPTTTIEEEMYNEVDDFLSVIIGFCRVLHQNKEITFDVSGFGEDL